MSHESQVIFMALHPLTADQVRRRCDPASFAFATTADLPYSDDIFGQPRGTHAIDFGVNMDAPGYNLFVLGPPGTGRTTAIQRYLRKTAPNQSAPHDWVYVHNFDEARRPVALCLTAGQATHLREAMDKTITQAQRKLPAAFETDVYDNAADEIAARMYKAQNDELDKVQAQATPAGFNLVQTASGLVIAPTSDKDPLTEAQLTEQAKLNDALGDALRRVHDVEKVAHQVLADLDADVARAMLHPLFGDVLAQINAWADSDEHRAALAKYLDAARDNLVDNVAIFKPAARGGTDMDALTQRAFLNRYRVNVFVDNCETCGAPIIIEDYPTYYNLIGRVDRTLVIASSPAASMIDHMLLRSGALHRANGGYLLLRASDVFSEDEAWAALKRSLMKNSVTIEEPNAQSQIMTGPTLDPHSVPLNVKVILHGTGSEYWAGSRDEDFRSLFKVKAEFGTKMNRTPDNERDYALFLRNRMDDEGLMPFEPSGVAALVEQGSREADDQKKLTTRFSVIADVAREAAFWAKRADHKAATADDVRTALKERHERLNRYEEDSREWMTRGGYFLQTSGVAVGQINGLSVIDLGDYEFGKPTRITARSYVSRGGISDIDRSVNFTDSTHNKGIAIIDSYLSGLYSVDQALSLSASIVFEQSYSNHEGDSASCALLIAMLSAVTNLPIPQNFGMTGTLDQFGFVRPIGGANVKIEGFFDTCKERGLDATHTQGVILPTANADDLMLREDVVEAIRDGKFRVIAAEHIDDLIELMFGMPAGARGADGKFPEGTLHAKVEAALKDMSDKLDGKRKGKDKDDKEEDKEEKGDKEPAPEPKPEPPPEPGPEPTPPPAPVPPPEPEPPDSPVGA